MAITWTAVAGTSNIAGHIYQSKSGTDTFTTNRFLTKFLTSDITALLADITSVSLFIKVTAVAGSDDYILTSGKSTDSNWGASIVAGEADFISTADHTEDTLTIASTGWKEFSIDKNNLDLSGETWFKIKNTSEGETASKNITFASQGNTTAGDRPYLKIVSGAGVQTVLSIGIIPAGSSAEQTMNQASDTDGHIRKVETIPTGTPPDISIG